MNEKIKELHFLKMEVCDNVDDIQSINELCDLFIDCVVMLKLIDECIKKKIKELKEKKEEEENEN